MNNETHNNQAITQYLLGSLPEAEAERFDELSITNDEFAETLKAAERDLVDAYVQGELAGPELERFRFHYLASPLRRQKVDFAQAFQVLGGKNAPEQAEVRSENAAKSSKKTKTSSWFSGLSVFTVPRLALQWGFAALALAFLIAGGWLALENVRLRHQMTQTQARREALGQREQELQKEIEGQRSASATTDQELARVREERERLEQELKKEQQRAVEQQRTARQQQPSSPSEVSIASFILAPQTRGVGQVATVLIPARTYYVAMQLELESDDYPVYRVALRDQAGSRIVWHSGNHKARAKGERKALAVSLRADLLRPQVYVLEVSGVPAKGATEIVSGYPFRVVKQ